MSPAETAEQIDMPFRGQICLDPRNDEGSYYHIGATWRMQLNDPCVAVMIN